MKITDKIRQIIVELKAMIIDYHENYVHDDEIRTSELNYLLTLIDSILLEQIDLTYETYNNILEQIIVTGAEEKNAAFVRIIRKYTELGAELLK